jgi:uncharacterized membrane protein
MGYRLDDGKLVMDSSDFMVTCHPWLVVFTKEARRYFSMEVISLQRVA